MTDLDAAIREWLRPVPTVDEWGEWMHHTHAALTAVLDVHATTDLGDGKPYCTECSSQAGNRVFEPCRTKQAIAEKLGVEAT